MSFGHFFNLGTGDIDIFENILVLQTFFYNDTSIIHILYFHGGIGYFGNTCNNCDEYGDLDECFFVVHGDC